MGLAFIASIARPTMLIYLICVLFYFSWKIISEKENKLVNVLLASSYVTGAEVYLRMTKAYFIWETGKYAIILFCVLGMIYIGFKRNAIPYIMYFLLLLPGILIAYEEIAYDVSFRKSIMFNFSGPLCLMVAAVFVYGKTITFTQMLKILDYMIYPLIATTVYVVLYSPDVREVVTGTASNSAISGGYGPNQVATVLGLGVFLLLTRLLIPYKNILVHWVMMFFMALMAYRALLTFSRGGVLVSVIMCLVFIIVYYFSSDLEFKIKTSIRVLGLVGAGLAIWTFTIFQTGGMIENRYANRDALGVEKGDITTGRAALFETEMDAFMKNPFFGTGLGGSKVFFETELGVELPTHNEISRMLSEHGMFGILALLTLIFAPIITKISGRKNIYFWPFLIFWALTIAHSSMRIAAPSFVYALCLLNIETEPKEKMGKSSEPIID